jgi:cell division protein FtsQ
VHIRGASPTAQADILKASGLYLNQPTLGMDLADVRTRVQGVGWVKDAKVVRMLPDTVLIAVEERPALAVWQNQGRMKVIDGEGRVITRGRSGALSHSCRWWWGRAPTKPPA